MKEIAPNVWGLTYPLKLMGLDLKRNVTVIRLHSGRLVIHSTGPFTPDDIASIKSLGEVGWLVEAMLRHDTFAEQGREAFPNVPYLAPDGFAKELNILTQPIFPLPAEWGDELTALELQGVPTMRETVFLHRPSRTLIVADLVFNFPAHEPLWSELMLKAPVGTKHHPGFSRAFKMSIKDPELFLESISRMMDWDFDRVIVGHGEIHRLGRQGKGQPRAERGPTESESSRLISPAPGGKAPHLCPPTTDAGHACGAAPHSPRRAARHGQSRTRF